MRYRAIVIITYVFYAALLYRTRTMTDGSKYINTMHVYCNRDKLLYLLILASYECFYLHKVIYIIISLQSERSERQ